MNDECCTVGVPFKELKDAKIGNTVSFILKGKQFAAKIVEFSPEGFMFSNDKYDNNRVCGLYDKHLKVVELYLDEETSHFGIDNVPEESYNSKWIECQNYNQDQYTRDVLRLICANLNNMDIEQKKKLGNFIRHEILHI